MSRSEQDRRFKNGARPIGVPDPEVIAGAARRNLSLLKARDAIFPVHSA